MRDSGFKTGLLVGGLAIAVVGLGVALLLTLDNDDDPPVSKTVIVTTQAESQRPAPSSASPPRTSTEPEQAPHSEPVAFSSPSGNLVCLMTMTSVRCAAAEFEYKPPPLPPSCSIPGWGHVVGIDTSGAGEFICADNAPANPDSPALPYGKGALVEPFACLSTESGIRCANRDTRHGFQIAREQVQVF